MMTLLMIGCVLGLVIVVVVVAGIALIMNSSDRDTVSAAREGWIWRRSEKDKEGW